MVQRLHVTITLPYDSLFCQLLAPRSTFDFLVGLVKEHPSITRNCKRTIFLTAQEQVAIALRFLATGDTYESVGSMCGASKSSVHNAVSTFCYALFRYAPEWIHFPSSVEEAKSIVADFERVGDWATRGRGSARTPGIPQVVGAMDGTQVLLARKPAHSGDAYIN